MGGKFSPCPHAAVTTSWLQTGVHNLTRPPVDCFAYDASVILTEITSGGDANLHVLRVPRTRHISGGTPKQLTHFNTDGIATFAWPADGKKFAITRMKVSGDLVLFKNMPQAITGPF